jgi:hypothetical protein
MEIEYDQEKHLLKSTLSHFNFLSKLSVTLNPFLFTMKVINVLCCLFVLIKPNVLAIVSLTNYNY